MKALHTRMCRSHTTTANGGRHRQRGATLAEYLPPLLFVLMVAIPAWAKYGEVVREQIAHAAERFSDYYYRGWFWPEEDQVAGAPPSQPGRGDSGSPDTGENNNGAGNGNGTDEDSNAGDGLGDDPFAGSPGTGIGNPFAPDPGSAGGDGPLQCAAPTAGGGGPSISLVGNAATYTQIGNPIDLGTGNKLQTETDFRSRRLAGLHFVRHYNSVLAETDSGLGHGWRYSYQRAIVSEGEDAATIWRDDGSQYRFERRDGQWRPPLGIVEQLATIDDEHGTRIGWRYTAADGSIEHYDADGRLLRLDHPAGQSQTLHYDNGAHLIRIADSRGEQLLLRWRGDHLVAVTTPDGDRLRYDHDDHLDLVTVIRRNAGVRGWFAGLRTPERRYHYDDTRHPHLLSGLDDATGARFATWRYDAMGRAISSEHGDGAERITIDYLPVTTTTRERRVTVTNATGHRATYTLEPARAGKWRLRSIDGAPAIDCVAVRQQHRYDERGFLTLQYSDGIASHYRRDARGRLIDERHGLRIDRAEYLRPAPGAVRIERRWLPERPLVASETHASWQRDDRHPQGHWQPVQQRDYHYDERGRPTLARLHDLLDTNGALDADSTSGNTPDDRSREWRHAYTFADPERSRLLEHRVTDPRGHTTIHTYDDERLQAITNALNQTTHISAYNHRHQPERIDLPDGQRLHLSYDVRGRPIRLVRSGGTLTETTTAEYDTVGRLIHLKHPDGSERRFVHNSAGQLVEVTNGWGERVDLTPNALHGQWQQLQLFAVDGNLHQQHHRRFNARGQLVALAGNASQQTTIDYDPRGNPVHLHQGHENPARADLTRTSHARHDTLGRLLTWVDAATHTTQFQYDPVGRLAAVTDANGNTTAYTHNGFGERVRERSPASGDVIQHFDAAGNMIERRADNASQADAIHFRYDALNRLVAVDYPGETDDIHYHYDQTGPEHGSGIGRLTRIETAQQIIDYRYDALGRRIAETAQDRNAKGRITHTTTLTHRYDDNGRLTAIGYPDGSEVRYHHDRERITRITYRDPAGTSHTLIDDIAHAPFGGPVRWTYGNGLTQTKTLDRDGRITEITLHPEPRSWPGQHTTDNPVWSQRYDYDLYNNITRIDKNGTGQEFGYDALHRLTAEKLHNKTTQFAYDPVGNRRKQTANDQVTSYGYTQGNRLTQRDDMTITIDGSGNLLDDGTRRFEYNALNRPISFYEGDQLHAQYHYNANGLRTRKTTYTTGKPETTYFSYAPDTRLLSAATPNHSTHYIWLGHVPIAQLDKPQGQNTAITYLHTDHLLTPRVASNDLKKIVWRWDSNAFGSTAPESDPDKDGKDTIVNLRFPGQLNRPGFRGGSNS